MRLFRVISRESLSSPSLGDFQSDQRAIYKVFCQVARFEEHDSMRVREVPGLGHQIEEIERELDDLYSEDK